MFTGAPNGPFVSPDGQWIGFADGRGVLKKVPVTGGPAVTAGDTRHRGPRGATWGPDDTIIVATTSVETGLQRVSAAGGPMTVLTRPDRAQGEADHFWPEMLPGGRAVLFTITAMTGGLDAAQVAVLDLQTGMRKILVRGGSHAHYVPSGPGSPRRSEREGGHLVYAAGGTLRAVPFDLARLETRGTPVTGRPDVVTTINGGVDAVVAGNGTLVYVPGQRTGPRVPSCGWTARAARRRFRSRRARISFPRCHPMARASWCSQTIRSTTSGSGISVGTTLTRLTFDPGFDGIGVWTPDGRRVIFSSDRTGVRNLFRQAADGTGAVERLTESPNTQYPSAVSPDGRRLIFTEEAPRTGDDVMMMELDGTRRVTPLVQSPFNERNGSVSPDGRWLAYEANDSGRVRNLCAAVSGREQRSLDGVHRRRYAADLDAQRSGAVLCLPVRARSCAWA